MKDLYKNTRQVEFASLMHELEEKGYKPADVARLLKMSKASVSQILKGEQNPRPATIDLFRRIVSEMLGKTPAPPVHEKSHGELHDKLSALEKHDPAGFEAAKLTIDTLHKKLPKPGEPYVLRDKKRKSNSSKSVTAKEVVKAALGQIERS